MKDVQVQMAKCPHSSKVPTISIAAAGSSFQGCELESGETGELNSSLALTSTKTEASFLTFQGLSFLTCKK